MRLESIDLNDLVLIERIGKLRADVWAGEGYLRDDVCSNGIWLDELDPIGKHWAVFEGDEMIAASRLTLHTSLEDIPHADEFSPYELKLGLPYGFMSRLVIKKEFRGKGLSKKMDLARLQEAKRCGAKAVIMLPTPYRVESVCKLGFVDFGLSGVRAEDMPDLKMQMHVAVHYLNEIE